MKYKVLLIGNNKGIIGEFFTYTDCDFECVSTSEYYDDVMNHVKFVNPDVIAYCLYQEKLDDMKRFINIAEKLQTQGIPLVIIGSSADCNEFLKMGIHLNPLALVKPITIKEIVTEIIKMLKKREAFKKKHLEEEGAEAVPEIDEIDDMIEAVLNAGETEAETEETAPDAQPKRRKHILLVDDDSRVLRLLKSYLEERYDLATAITGKVALKFLETRETDLVLLDYEMLTENGAAVLEKIRANEKTKNLPVVFLTGVTEENKIREVLELKPQGYLLKPIDVDKLSSTIKGILD